uniref:Uncharacterized protein n=1 Tax=Heterorhabditis bacteriophora TaxID=37862 RepID=A0A1I7WYC5_HETBA
MFNQRSSLTNSYFGWQLLNSYPSDEFGKRKEKEMKDAFWFLNGTDPTLQIPLRPIKDSTRGQGQAFRTSEQLHLRQFIYALLLSFT